MYASNGVGKIGNKLYFSGGKLGAGNLPDFTNRLWAYDYTQDRMIRKADMPIFSAEGVTGVIGTRLYVLPGACGGNAYPNPGYCAEEATRRFYRYDPGTDTWTSRRQDSPLSPRRRGRGNCGQALRGGRRRTRNPRCGRPRRVRSGDQHLAQLAPLPTAGFARGAALGGEFHVLVVRYDGTTPDFRHYAYSPVTGQWKTKAPPDVIGSATKVTLNGSARIFTATGNRSALFTP